MYETSVPTITELEEPAIYNLSASDVWMTQGHEKDDRNPDHNVKGKAEGHSSDVVGASSVF